MRAANSDKEMKAGMFFASTCSSMGVALCNHLGNLFDDVKHKLEYRMRLVYFHSPFSTDMTNDGKSKRLVSTSAKRSYMR